MRHEPPKALYPSEAKIAKEAKMRTIAVAVRKAKDFEILNTRMLSMPWRLSRQLKEWKIGQLRI